MSFLNALLGAHVLGGKDRQGKTEDFLKQGKIGDGLMNTMVGGSPIAKTIEFDARRLGKSEDDAMREGFGKTAGISALIAAPFIAGAAGGAGATGATGATGAAGTTGATAGSNASLFKNLMRVNDLANLVNKKSATTEEVDPYYNDTNMYRGRIQRPQVTYGNY